MTTTTQYEELKADAQKFVELTKQLKGAREEISSLHSQVSTYCTALEDLTKKMKQYVGRNVPNRIVHLSGGLILTLEFAYCADDTERVVLRAFDADGEEIR